MFSKQHRECLKEHPVQLVWSELSKTQTVHLQGKGRKRPTLEVGGAWQINGTLSDLMNNRKHQEVERAHNPKPALRSIQRPGLRTNCVCET